MRPTWPGYATCTATCTQPPVGCPYLERSATVPSSTIPTPTWPTRPGTRPAWPGTPSTTRTTTRAPNRSRRAGIRATCSTMRWRSNRPDPGHSAVVGQPANRVGCQHVATLSGRWTYSVFEELLKVPQTRNNQTPPTTIWWPQRDSNPCLVVVTFSPKILLPSEPTYTRHADGPKTRRHESPWSPVRVLSSDSFE